MIYFYILATATTQEAKSPFYLDLDFWLQNVVITLIVGVIGTWIYSWFNNTFSAKVKYKLAAQKANADAISSIRNIISRAKNLNSKTLDGIINSHRIQNKINKEDMITLNDGIDILLSEIANTPFLNNEQKEELFKVIVELKNNDIKKDNDPILMPKDKLDKTSLIGAIFSIMFALMSLIIFNFLK